MGVSHGQFYGVAFQTEEFSDRLVFVALLSRDGRGVLVTDGRGVDTSTAAENWRLPLFMYNAGWYEEADRLIRDLASALGLNNNVECCAVGKPFSFGPDLLGSQAIVTAGFFGLTSLQVLNLHDELDFEPSSTSKWADANLMTELSEAAIKQRYDTDDKRKAKELGREWGIEAACWFRHSLEKLGEVELRGPALSYLSSVTSTIFRVETNQGWYFLKAPCVNC